MNKGNLERLVGDARTVAVIDMQWGDNGKGKFVDLIAEWAEIVGRGTGGANAGHTICVDGVEYILHLIPVGIIRDKDGLISVVGTDVAFEPKAARDDLTLVEQAGGSYNNLQISYRAPLVLPQHIVMDCVNEAAKGKTKIGTTQRGIGPVYADRVSRTGLTVNDMLNLDVLAKKVKENLTDKLKRLQCEDPEFIRSVMEKKNLLHFYHTEELLDADAIIEAYRMWGAFYKPMVADTDTFMQESVGKRRILLEGAQGHLLSVDYGPSPNITSSDCSVRGLAKGVGLSAEAVDLTLGIAKGFYMTRVGSGPFPTELGGKESEEWCDTHKREQERQLDPSMNSTNPLHQGIALRQRGGEYGATTGRPRRTGWLDLPLLRLAAKTNGPQVVMTKLDVLSGVDTIPICVAHRYDGPEYNVAGTTLHPGDTLEIAIPDDQVLSHCSPMYVHMPGWQEDITGCTSYDQLPKQLHNIVDFVEEKTRIQVRALSNGRDRSQVVVR